MFGALTGQGQLIGAVYTGQLLGASGPCAEPDKHRTHNPSCCLSNTLYSLILSVLRLLEKLLSVSRRSILRQKLEIISS